MGFVTRFLSIGGAMLVAVATGFADLIVWENLYRSTHLGETVVNSLLALLTIPFTILMGILVFYLAFGGS